jgi:hypothetical protein
MARIAVGAGMSGGRVTFEELKKLRKTTWQTTFDLMTERGVAFVREPRPFWYFGVVASIPLMLIAPALLDGTLGSFGAAVFVLAAIVVLAGAGIARAIDRARAPTLIADDRGIEIWRRGRQDGRAEWGELVRTWPFVTSPNVSFWLPLDIEGRELLRALTDWSCANRRAIAAEDGSLRRTIETMAAGEGIRFAVTWRGALVGTAIFIAFAPMIWFADDRTFGEWTIGEIVGAVGLLLVLAAILLRPLLTVVGPRREVVVSERGLEAFRGGERRPTLTWDEMTPPDALRLRRQKKVLGCDRAGRTVESTELRAAEVLEAIVDHLLVRELERRGLTGALSPEDVRGER